MTGTIAFRRKAADRVMTWVFVLCALLVVLPLFLILFDLVIKGAKEFRWTLLVDLPRPVGEPGGGIANGIVGTIVVTLLAMAGSVPVSVMTGIYLAEYGRGKFASAVRFAADTMTGVPSIIMGIFGYILLVLPMKRFSAWAGAAALSMIFIPIVVRTRRCYGPCRRPCGRPPWRWGSRGGRRRCGSPCGRHGRGSSRGSFSPWRAS